jgi:hypothetical protein
MRNLDEDIKSFLLINDDIKLNYSRDLSKNNNRNKLNYMKILETIKLVECSIFNIFSC